MLHNMGREFGATTGRPRRCGWFDAVAFRQAVRVNGIDQLAITNIDGLDKLPEFACARISWAVRPSITCQPISRISGGLSRFTNFSGWQWIPRAKVWKDLPTKVEGFLKAMSKAVGAKVVIASVGPGRIKRFLYEGQGRPVEYGGSGVASIAWR